MRCNIGWTAAFLRYNLSMWKLFDKLLIVFVRFFKGLQFAALEYDTKLQRTGSGRQRIFFWVKVFVGAVIIFILVVFALRLIYSSIVLF